MRAVDSRIASKLSEVRYDLWEARFFCRHTREGVKRWAKRAATRALRKLARRLIVEAAS